MKNMTVLVHSNKGSHKSFVLSFQNGVTPSDVKSILKSNAQEAAVRLLISRSSGVLEVRPESRQVLEHLADFVISETYTTERLA